MATSSFEGIQWDLFTRNPLLNSGPQAQPEQPVDLSEPSAQSEQPVDLSEPPAQSEQPVDLSEPPVQPAQPEQPVDIVVVSLSEVNLLKDHGLPRDLLPNARILHFNYNYVTSTETTSAPFTLEDVTRQLLRRLLAIRSECPLRPIVFVGHSLGGLVIQKVLCSTSPYFSSNSSISMATAGVVFYCTPNVLETELPILVPFKQELELLSKEYYGFLSLINRQLLLVHSFYEVDIATVAATASYSSDYPNIPDNPDSSSFIVPGFPSAEILAETIFLSNANGGAEIFFRKSSRLDDTTSIEIGDTQATANENEDILKVLPHINCKSILERKIDVLPREQGSWILENSNLTKWLNGPKSQVLWLHGDAGVGKTAASTFLIQELASIQKLRNKINSKRERPPRHNGNPMAYFFCQRSESNHQSAAFILSSLLHQLLQQLPHIPVRPSPARVKQWEEAENFSSEDLTVLWRHIIKLLSHDSVRTAYLVIDGLDECSQLRDDFIHLLQPYITGIPQFIRHPLPGQASLVGSTSSVHLRGGSGRYILHERNKKPPAPTIDEQLGADYQAGRFHDAEHYVQRQPPPLLHPRPPPPPGSQPFGPPPPFGQQPMSQFNYIQEVDGKPSMMLTAEDCRKKLTQYQAYSIRKATPPDPQDKPTWARAEVADERLAQQDILKQTQKLNEARLSISEKETALAPFQRGQVTALLAKLADQEPDGDYGWTLAQIDRVERDIRVGLREIIKLIIYVQRAPRDGLDLNALHQNIERNRAAALRPPPQSLRQNLTTKIGIFITSRNDESLSQQLSMALDISINLSSEEQSRRLIDINFPKVVGLDKQFADKLKEQLVEKAQGRLPWIKLAIRELKTATNNETLATFLDTVPSQFEDFYKLSLTRDSGLRNTVGRAILTSVSVAMRPLNLSELRFLMKPIQLPEANSDPLIRPEPLLEATGPFLDISTEGRIWFIHDTARQYVTMFLQEDQIDSKSLHAALAEHCFKHVCTPQMWTNPSSYLDYPIAFWMEHGRLASEKAVLGDALSNEFFQKSSTLREKWFDAYWRIRYPKEDKPSGFTLSHILAESGYYQLLKQLTDQRGWSEDLNSLDSIENMPLHWASRNGHLRAVRILLEGTNNCDRENVDELTPLHFAAIGGHCQIAEQLIRSGANINSQARNATTVLQSAASNGHKEMIRTLLDGGAFLDATNLDGYRAQHLARNSGHIESADMLRDFESRMISTESLPEIARIDGGFFGAIVDFVHKESGLYVHKKVSVDRMLSKQSFDSIMAGVKGELSRDAEGVNANVESRNQKKPRWLHLPANNMRWVEILMNKHYCGLEMPEAARAILRPEVWTERQHLAGQSIIHGRFMKPGCQKVSTIIAPRTDRSHQDPGMLLMASSRKLSGPNVALEKSDRYERLVWKYLYDEHPLQVRRTLDQSYYSTLQSTETRDVDQIPYKYFHQHFTNSTMHPVLMVDQLWLWILDENTVITSFPQRWTEPKKDDLDTNNKTDVLEAIIRSVDKSEATIPDGYKLAEFIVNACASLCFAVTLSHDGNLPFPGCYGIIIGQVADIETHLFREFTQAVRDEAEGAEGAAKGNSKATLNVDESTFSIHRETEQLEVVKDVRDELNMILIILRDQLKAVDESNHISLFKPTSLHDSICLHENEIKALDRRAEKVYIALKDLLDLKQKQANVAEARSQRHQAEETTTQGKAILLFTIITIIFLPLSFLSSFFAIQIVEFPTLTLSFVLRYMFPITAAISLPCILVALKFDAISKLSFIKGRFSKLWTIKRTKKEVRKLHDKNDVEKGLKDAQGSRERSGSSQSRTSGSSVLSWGRASRRTRE
ncbi:Ankyrin-2 [Lachnellula arida]|uniref:Ankyrin-2 n=1 Tax=Lachnellula arida TaxID=1316785 RepID=A0A8T9BFT9_9HELO|nr:Ankyrin-2 [Lachnellula arida]